MKSLDRAGYLEVHVGEFGFKAYITYDEKAEWFDYNVVMLNKPKGLKERVYFVDEIVENIMKVARDVKAAK